MRGKALPGLKRLVFMRDMYVYVRYEDKRTKKPWTISSGGLLSLFFEWGMFVVGVVWDL